MADRNDNSNEILLKISASVADKQTNDTPSTSKLEDGHKLLERTNIEPARVKRNTEHGLTEMQTLKFVTSDQRRRALRLLDNPSLYSKLSSLFDFISELGCDNDAEKRFYASLAVSELAVDQPFVDLKESIILRWATSSKFSIQQSAARTLSHIIKHERCEMDVLKLLKYWSSTSNRNLNNTAFLTYYRIAQSYPHETLDAVRNVLKKEDIVLSPQIMDVVIRVYDLYPRLIINYIHEWLVKNARQYLRWLSGLIFLLMIRLDDVPKGQESDEMREKVVEIIFNLWDDPKIPMRLEIQEDTTKKVESWAKETLEAWENDEIDLFESHRKLFYDLYRKYEGQRTNRLDFHLRRWQKRKEWEKKRAARLGTKNSTTQQKKEGSFIDLIPQV